MPLSADELNDLDIMTWSQCAESFLGADLLLGNGFSLSLSSKFSYSSLFQKFLNKCNSRERGIYETFTNTNFEAIQHDLLITQRVNSYFGIDSSALNDPIVKLHNGLVEVIQENHPKSEDIDYDVLKRLSEQLDTFGNIFTLNYDLYLYHIIMASNDRYGNDHRIRPYQDYFWSRWRPPFLEFMDYQNYEHFKHVYYLHGALFLFPGWPYGHHNTLKISRSGGRELLDVIGEQINSGRLPLFVSEGGSSGKLKYISDNSYLIFARSKFRNALDTMVIFGCSLSRDQDQHIIDALKFKRRIIACSVFVGSKNSTHLKEEIHDTRSKLAHHEVTFFDSSTLFSI